MTSRRVALVIALFVFAALAAPAWGQDPADQPPFGGAPVPPLVEQSGKPPPPGFHLSPLYVERIAENAAREDGPGILLRSEGGPTATVATRGGDSWEVRFRDPA